MIDDPEDDEVMELKNKIMIDCLDFADKMCDKFDCPINFPFIAMLDTAVVGIITLLSQDKEEKSFIDKIHRAIIVIINRRFKEFESINAQNTPSAPPSPADTPK